MASLRSPKKSLQFKRLKPAIEPAGFSAPEPAERAREVIGHSPLLAIVIRRQNKKPTALLLRVFQVNLLTTSRR
ncbi:hypothetical protein RI103_08380 [Paraburkholderia sp. FT54]|uniref:hypothetical protein n=1 Tax=Paraburkholderia sp. FT54 TaxID=3074437 RepID=UPI00287743ED|nr:hypothetical protein [Paraburkholderia sp. FT54]WNC91784.1 hypothetical protein RI103_08380 [Paraburkholderia sp. FT54]